MKWVNKEDGLPPIDKEVLLYDGKSVFYGELANYKEWRYCKGLGVIETTGYLPMSKIISWAEIELPENNDFDNKEKTQTAVSWFAAEVSRILEGDGVDGDFTNSECFKLAKHIEFNQIKNAIYNGKTMMFHQSDIDEVALEYYQERFIL